MVMATAEKMILFCSSLNGLLVSLGASEILISFVLQADRQLVTGSLLFCLIFVAGSVTTWIGVCGVSLGFFAGARAVLLVLVVR